MSVNGAATDKQLASYEPIILVTRGDELPKTNLGRKLHPTYETSIRIKNNSGNQQTTPHYVVKFYDQYRELQEKLLKLNIGPGAEINIEAPFPPKYTKSNFGGRLTEEELQHRCYLLNKWMSAIFNAYPSFPSKAQVIMSEFLSLHDDDVDLERNKELILSLLRNRKEVGRQGSFSSLKRSNSFQRQHSNSDLTKLPQQQQQKSGSFSTNSTATASAAAIAAVGSETKALTSANLMAMSAAAPKYNTFSSAPSRVTDKGEKLFKDSSSLSSITAADWDMYEAPTVVHGFLTVRVSVGDMKLPKGSDAKLHHSFQTTVQLLPFNEVRVTDKDAIDEAAYTRQQEKLQPISICRVFDAYRTLKMDLEMLHIYSLDDTEDINKDKDMGYTVIVVQSYFPRTLKKSALGMGIGEKELRRRSAIMNLWFGSLLNMFSVLPTDGKNMVVEFLGLSVDYHGETAAAIMEATALAILRGSYQPPLLSNRPAGPQKRSSLVALFGRNAPEDSEVKQAAAAETAARSAAGRAAGGGAGTGQKKIERSLSASNFSHTAALVSAANSGGVTNSPAGGRINMQRSGSFNQLASRGRWPSDTESHMDSMRETLYEDTTMLAAQEVQVGQFLGCTVCRGELLAKKAGEKPSHPSYEIVLRILNLNEVVIAEKEKVNETVYNKLIEMGPLRKAHVFDVYRNLKKNLEEEHVFSLDRMTEAEAAREHGKRVVLIERDFPRTYRRQSIGIKLKEHQLHRRMVMLNDFMGALMQAFPVMPPPAQELILTFLTSKDGSMNATMEEGEDTNDDVARKQQLIIEQDKEEKKQAVIIAMLRRTFVPERIPEPAPQRSAFGRGGSKKISRGVSNDSGIVSNSTVNSPKGTSPAAAANDSNVGGDGEAPVVDRSTGCCIIA